MRGEYAHKTEREERGVVKLPTTAKLLNRGNVCVAAKWEFDFVGAHGT